MAFLSGWTVNELLDDLTFDQVQFVLNCMLKHKSDVANFVMEAVSTALGGKVKDKSKRRKGRSKGGDSSDFSMSKNQKEALSKLSSMGIAIREEKA